MYRILPRFTASPLQVSAYLGGIALFSISFLVFLNASISFVITDVIGKRTGVGNAVGTLGFADELVALVACPVWGLVSDRIGVRWVAVTGYCVIGFSLVCLVQSAHVYPDLVIWRMVFSIGGAACTTMVTAILPTMTAPMEDASQSTSATTEPEETYSDRVSNENRHSFAPSESSDMTITPARFSSARSPLLARYRRNRQSVADAPPSDSPDPHAAASQLAGVVGMFTGIGALVALLAFLPLPAVLGKDVSKALALQHAFYIVGATAVVVAVLVGFGLRNLPGESHKGPRHLFRWTTKDAPAQGANYPTLLLSALHLGLTDPNIFLGYVGGLVARASSVCISSFIPLFVNAYFIREGLCSSDPSAPLQQACKEAYTLASMLTGFSQLAALLAAPLYGFAAGRLARRPLGSKFPLAMSAVVGILGAALFASLDSPDPKRGQGRTAVLAVVLLGLAQIGAIVCSLALLARGIQTRPATVHEAAEDAGLLAQPVQDRNALKGSIAGVYSLAGGAGILLLTKLGGHLFDTADPGAPFWMMVGFSGVLLVAVTGVAVGGELQRRWRGQEAEQDV